MMADMNDTDTGSHELPTVVRMPAEEILPATRLPPISVPPMHGDGGRPASVAPQGSYPPPSIPRGAGVRTFLRWKALVGSFFTARPSQSGTTATPLALDNHVVQRLGLLSICFGIVVAVAGVAVALRSASMANAVAPVIAASLIISRALAGLGLVAFGVGLMRLGERLLLSKSGGLLESERSISPPTSAP
jgi:hypothetical protein